MRSQPLGEHAGVVVAVAGEQDRLPAGGQGEHEGHRRGLPGAEDHGIGVLDRAERLLERRPGRIAAAAVVARSRLTQRGENARQHRWLHDRLAGLAPDAGVHQPGIRRWCRVRHAAASAQRPGQHPKSGNALTPSAASPRRAAAGRGSASPPPGNRPLCGFAGVVAVATDNCLPRRSGYPEAVSVPLRGRHSLSFRPGNCHAWKKRRTASTCAECCCCRYVSRCECRRESWPGSCVDG